MRIAVKRKAMRSEKGRGKGGEGGRLKMMESLNGKLSFLSRGWF